MRITLQNPITIVNEKNGGEQVVNDELVVLRMVDSPVNRVIRVFFTNIDFPIILWQGVDYDTIGQWTDTDVINRIKTIYNIQ